MGESLNPTLLSRLAQRVRPDWTRTVAARRGVAGGLVLLAAVTALRPNPAGERTEVVVATRDLAPGTALSMGDVRLERRSAATVPDGSPADLDAVVGATLAGPARRGEVLTDVRLLGSRLAGATAGPDARIVGIHLADAALADLVRPGDVVDIVVVAGSDAEAKAKVVAVGAVVVSVSAKERGRDERVVLVALPGPAANAVAAAALIQAVTLTLH